MVNSVSPECDREVMRILEATNGKWKAGTTNGNPAEMETEVSVVFCQGSVKNMVATAKNYQKKGNKWLMEKNNPQKAVQYYNRAIVLLPNEESLLAMRSICYFQLGDENQAFADCERIKYLVQKNGNVDVFENLAHINQNTAGYNELVETLKH